MKKHFMAFASLFIASLALGGCGRNSGAVRLNETVHSVFYAPQYAALELGFFKDEGLDVTVTPAGGSDKSMIALLANQADIALLGTETGIYAYNQGREDYPVAFAQLTRKAGNFLVSREDEKDFTWTDVKGKQIIGGRLGGMPEMLLEYILVKNGVIPGEDVEIINNISYDSTSLAFINGVGDYTVEFEPSATALEARGAGHVVASLGDDSGEVPYTVYMATKDYLSKNPDIAQKFTNAVYRGQIWVDTHSSREIAEAIHPQFKENSLDELTTMVERYKAVDSWNTDPIFPEECFTLLQDILEQGNQLVKRVPYADMITNRYAEKAIAEKAISTFEQ
ncbi:MAG: ABC transporter substrate-binding protein [Clostridiales bacterium]|jgi:NitT/TauT family transport system substrate-binding protein|nr:ABC transporter substrate-binding protein [Clostridiales bacterium]